jgi:cytosine/adenosine deaminase-related metal-dependent hydrolase
MHSCWPLETDTRDREVYAASLEAIDRLMDSGTATSRHPDVLHALQEARAMRDRSDMDRLRKLHALLTARLAAIDAVVQEHGLFPDMCLVSSLMPRGTSCGGIQ